MSIEFVDTIDDLAEDAAPSLSADFLLTKDTSSGLPKRVKPENLLADYALSADVTTGLATKVGKTGNETVAGIKTFSSSPIVPTPENADQTTHKGYVDAAVAAITTAQPDISALVSGGIVSWISALTFQVSAAVYFIQGVLYNSDAQQITLDAADATDDRIDVLALDDNGDFVKITGDPASEPNEPSYDPAAQLKLTFVLVPASATIPEGATSEDIYLENTQWTSSTSGSGFNANSTSNPFAGSKDIEGTAVATNAYVQLTRSSSTAIDDFDQLAFYIRSKAAWGKKSIKLQFNLAGVAKGSPVTVKGGLWGFDDTITASYQFVAIPLTQFVLPPGTLIDQLRITGLGASGTLGLYLDNISLRNTGTTGTVTQGITQEQADARYVQLTSDTEPIGIACSDETTALTTGTKATFRMPYAFTLTALPRASLSTAQTTGSIFTVDINEGGSSILSTKLTIDNTEKTSTTATTPAALSDASLADDAEITIDIDQVGDGTAKGLKVWLIGRRT